MLNYIFEFDQTKLLELDEKLSANDVIILHYIVTALSSSKTKKLVDDSKIYVWIQGEKLLTDLPILSISKQRLYHLILNYVKMGLIEKKQICNNDRGSKCYICITEKLLNVMNTECNAYKTLVKNDNCSQPLVKNDNSNNTNNISNSTIVLSKDNTNTTIPTTNFNSDFSFGRRKKSKPNLYQNCLGLINDFTDDCELREKLREYLDLRLQMKDKSPLKYQNQWKGMLKKLKELSTDKQTMLEIIDQSIVKGWGSFFELNQNKFSQNNIERITGKKSGVVHYENEDQNFMEGVKF